MFEIIKVKNFNNSSWRKETFYSVWKDVPCIFFIILNWIFHIPNQSISLENVRNKVFQEMKPYFLLINLINISQVLLLYFPANKKTGEGI